jgi:hypothetical protein
MMKLTCSHYLVASDSFVKPLASYQKDSLVGEICLGDRGVDLIGLPGKGVLDVCNSLINLPWVLYSVISLAVGGNDLCCALFSTYK